jgi:hypothetical protein
MRASKSLLAITATLCLVAGSSAVAGSGEAPKSAAAPAAKTTPWKLTGELEESCSCNAACPCWFGSKPTMSTCSGGEAFFITSGKYGNVKLDGLAMAGIAQSPEGKTMMESFGSYNLANLYIDEKATPEQRKALEAIGGQVFGPAASPDKMVVRYVPITRKIEGKNHTVTFGNYGTFTGSLMDAPGGGTPRIMNPMIPDPMHKEYSQGMTSHQTFNDGLTWDFSGTNYMYNHFTVTNVDYEKMAAMMEAGAKSHDMTK